MVKLISQKYHNALRKKITKKRSHIRHLKKTKQNTTTERHAKDVSELATLKFYIRVETIALYLKISREALFLKLRENKKSCTLIEKSGRGIWHR